MTSTNMGEVITFYSYKGGTGRSMALSNIACLLAERQSEKNGVLIIDWDLEAPGLHRFFYSKLKHKFISTEDPSRAFDEHPGLIDLFLELEAATPSSGYDSNEEAEEMAEATVHNVQLDRFVIHTQVYRVSAFLKREVLMNSTHIASIRSTGKVCITGRPGFSVHLQTDWLNNSNTCSLILARATRI